MYIRRVHQRKFLMLLKNILVLSVRTEEWDHTYATTVKKYISGKIASCFSVGHIKIKLIKIRSYSKSQALNAPDEKDGISYANQLISFPIPGYNREQLGTKMSSNTQVSF